MAILSYEDKKYQQKDNFNDSLAQAFQDLKRGTVSAQHSWNMPLEQLRGMTMKVVGDSLILTYHRYEVTTIEGLARLEEDGLKFVRETAKELKKRFKKLTGQALKLKEVQKDPAYIEKASKLSADTSWLLNSSTYGYGQRPVGKYLIRDSIVYKIG